MKYLSTIEVAEKWGISHRRVGILCNETASPAHRGRVDDGLSPKMQRSPPMQESRAENISSQKQKIDANRKGGAEHGAQILIRQHQRAFAGFDERT